MIHVSGIQVFAHHGVFPEEKADGQLFVVDVDVELDAARAIETDRVEHTLNYAELAQLIHDEVKRDPVDLLETVAYRVVSAVFGHSSLASFVSVTIHKPQVSMPVTVDQVSVTISRSREDVA